jgi:hypothetical protein
MHGRIPGAAGAGQRQRCASPTLAPAKLWVVASSFHLEARSRRQVGEYGLYGSDLLKGLYTFEERHLLGYR